MMNLTPEGHQRREQLISAGYSLDGPDLIAGGPQLIVWSNAVGLGGRPTKGTKLFTIVVSDTQATADDVLELCAVGLLGSKEDYDAAEEERRPVQRLHEEAEVSYDERIDRASETNES